MRYKYKIVRMVKKHVISWWYEDWGYEREVLWCRSYEEVSETYQTGDIVYELINGEYINIDEIISERDKLEEQFMSIWDKRMKQRMSPEFDWDTMTHPDDDEEVLQELI
jgi:hypothetical protein